MNEKPKFQHDCNVCKFLGTVVSDNLTPGKPIEYDLYYCVGGVPGLSGTCLARFGNEGPDYTSSLSSLIKLHTVFDGSPLLEAKQRAELVTE
jgi:hypothetical protein